MTTGNGIYYQAGLYIGGTEVMVHLKIVWRQPAWISRLAVRFLSTRSLIALLE